MGKKRKIAVAAFAAAAAISAMAVGNELSGYALFDRADGSNALCDVDPTCRYLNDKEVKIAQSIFDKQLDYKRVKIFNRSAYAYFIPSAFMAPNGNIYVMRPNKNTEDFSKDLWYQTKLIHEMTHVWQRSQGMNMYFTAANTSYHHDFHYTDAYKYKLEEGKKFSDYNLEQQAEMVSHYYRDRERLHESFKFIASPKVSPQGKLFMLRDLKKECEKLSTLEKVVAPVLGGKQDSLCRSTALLPY